MNTSNYSKNGNNPTAVSIAGKAPIGYKGREYKKLAPKYWFFKKYKDDGDKNFYIQYYYKEVLDNLDPQIVFAELGEDSIILCYEKEGDFCHRRLVAEWLQNKLGVVIEEI